MRWEDEQYVRVYKRNTPEWCLLRWQARGLLLLILRELDRAGILELGKVELKAIAVAVRAPWDEIEPFVNELLVDGCIVHREDLRLLIAPNFIEAQEANSSDRARQKASRERARDLARAKSHGVTVAAQPVTPCRDDASHAVTDNHATAVNGHSVLSSAKPISPNTPSGTVQKGGRAQVRSDVTSPEAQAAEASELAAPAAPSHPEALTISIFEELFRKRYKRDFEHTSFGHKGTDEWEFIRISKHAATKPDPERWLRHVFREYLRDEDRFLVKNVHAPRFFMAQLNKYGDPKKVKPLESPKEPEPSPREVTRPFVPLPKVAERGPAKAPSTETELREKAERDKARLLESEKLAAAGKGSK